MNTEVMVPGAPKVVDVRAFAIVLADNDFRLAAERVNGHAASDEEELEIRAYAIEHADEVAQVTYAVLRLEMLAELRGEVREMTTAEKFKLFSLMSGESVLSFTTVQNNNQFNFGDVASPRERLAQEFDRITGRANSNGHGGG